MKHFMVFFFILLTPAAFATPPADAIVLSVSDSPYWVDPNQFYLGYSVNVLRHGYPMGHLEKSAPNKAPVQNASQLEQEMKDTTRENLQGIATAENRIQSSIQDLHKTPAASIANFTAAPVHVGAVAIDFEACAKLSLTHLKQKIRLETFLQSESRSPERLALQKTLDALNARLQEQRGSAGFVCGKGQKYLEVVTPPTDIEQIKALAAILARTGSERVELLKTLALAMDPAVNGSVRQTWSWLWMKLAMTAVFSSKALPSWSEIIEDIKNNPVSAAIGQFDFSPLQLRITHSLPDLDATYSEGLEILERRYGAP